MFDIYDPIVFATVVIAGATVANVGVAILMWIESSRTLKHSQRIFKDTHRPFIGIYDPRIIIANNTAINPSIRYKNFGSLPARNITLRVDIILNGNTIASESPFEKPVVLFQGDNQTWAATIAEGTVDKVFLNPQTHAEIVIRLDYESVDETCYLTEERYRFNHSTNEFELKSSTWE